MMNASCVFSGEAEGETGDKSSVTADQKNASGEGNGVAAYKFSILPEYPRVAHEQDANAGFANAAAGKGEKLLPKDYLQLSHERAVSHAELRLRSICMSVIDRFRANMNWQRMQIKASSLVCSLAHRVPELRGCLSLPTTGFNPPHVLPIASGLRSHRRYVKQKNTGSEKQKAVIRALKRQCRRHMSSNIESVDEAKELLADLLDATVRSGFRTVSSVPSHPLENEGAQFLQPIPGTFTEAKTSGPSTNAGTSKHEGEAGCHTITARQEDSDGRKNSRDELATAEQDRDSKRQRSNGAPREATLVMPGYCAVENLSAKPSGGETAAP
ncbi:hypothetical protein VPH35_023404 [Triticum aestivum]